MLDIIKSVYHVVEHIFEVYACPILDAIIIYGIFKLVRAWQELANELRKK